MAIEEERPFLIAGMEDVVEGSQDTFRQPDEDEEIVPGVWQKLQGARDKYESLGIVQDDLRLVAHMYHRGTYALETWAISAHMAAAIQKAVASGLFASSSDDKGSANVEVYRTRGDGQQADSLLAVGYIHAEDSNQAFLIHGDGLSAADVEALVKRQLKVKARKEWRSKYLPYVLGIGIPLLLMAGAIIYGILSGNYIPLMVLLVIVGVIAAVASAAVV